MAAASNEIAETHVYDGETIRVYQHHPLDRPEQAEVERNRLATYLPRENQAPVLIHAGPASTRRDRIRQPDQTIQVVPSWTPTPADPAQRWDNEDSKQLIRRLLIKFLGHQLPLHDPNNRPPKPSRHKLWYRLDAVMQQWRFDNMPTEQQVLWVLQHAHDDYFGERQRQFEIYWQTEGDRTVYYACMVRRPALEQ